MPKAFHTPDLTLTRELVNIGVTPEAKKELVTIGDGLRESKESWLEVV